MRVRALAAAALLVLAAAAPCPAGDGPAAGPSKKAILEQTHAILSRSEFDGSDEEEGFLVVLANLLSDLVDRAKELRRANPFAYGTVVAWLVLTLLAILGHVAWTVWKGGGGASRTRAGPGLDDPALATRAGRDPATMLARADAAAADGRTEEAVAWLYLALLFRLERAGLLAFDPAHTGLEYADALARRPAERARWVGFLRLHDPVVFGARPCPRAAWEAMRAAATAAAGEPEGAARGA